MILSDAAILNYMFSKYISIPEQSIKIIMDPLIHKDEYDYDKCIKNMFYDCVMFALEGYPFQRSATPGGGGDPNSSFAA